MTDIYDQHRAAFQNVSAYVVLKDGQRAATVAFKFGNAVTAYVHLIGVEMTRGRAGGGGYDRQSAACRDAGRKVMLAKDAEEWEVKRFREIMDSYGKPFLDALERGDLGAGWQRSLEDAGFTVLQAV